MQRSTLPLPPFFNPANANNWDYSPSLDKLRIFAEEWRKDQKIKASAVAKKKVTALIIDANKDFCHPRGTLFVSGRSGTGAVDDSNRIAKWVYENLDMITDIVPTMDTHKRYQIFTPTFWQMADGTPVPQNQIIPLDMIASGKIKVIPAMVNFIPGATSTWINDYVQHYARKLETDGKKVLIAFAPHCVLGSDGHPIMGTVFEAISFHSYCRRVENDPEVKGGNVLTECFSVLGPEVKVAHDGTILDNGENRMRMIKTLLAADYVVIMGQASSHCVASTIDDLLTWILANDPSLANKVYVAEDGMSAVNLSAYGGPDFTDAATEALNKFRNAGMHVVRLSDPMETWPGIQLA
jgi:nicotinamidase-related amidase